MPTTMNSINRLMFDSAFLKNAGESLIGMDEVGRGALAGPVMTGAVWIDDVFFYQNKDNEKIFCIQDSKQKTAQQRLEAFQYIQEWQQTGHLQYAVGQASVTEIDISNIAYALRLSFRRSLENLALPMPLPQERNLLNLDMETLSYSCDHPAPTILVDGYALKNFPYIHRGIVKGDQKSFCIAAASIVAKVTRDQWMCQASEKYPHYHFEVNKGYGTLQHCQVLKTYGPCPLHRQTFITKLFHNKNTTKQSEFAF